jgi:hypothetical protein
MWATHSFFILMCCSGHSLPGLRLKQAACAVICLPAGFRSFFLPLQQAQPCSWNWWQSLLQFAKLLHFSAHVSYCLHARSNEVIKYIQLQ